MRKKELALEVIRRLKEEYPDADCTLDYDEAWKLLVSVRLAAQCTDARVNVVVEDLYAKFPDVNALADAPVEEIEEIVRPCGLGKSKARDISACMKILRDEYNGKVPDDFDKLLKLPGVGRKSANLIMGDVFGKPAIGLDYSGSFDAYFYIGSGSNCRGSEILTDRWNILSFHSGNAGLSEYYEKY